MNFAKTARNAAVAELALAFARDHLPGAKPRRRRPGAKALLLGGVAAAAAATVLLKRDKVAGLLPGRSDEPAPTDPGYSPPPVSNYDASGPVANTATAVPVPPAYEQGTIDEAAEEAAAAAEAGNIGGEVSGYAGPEGEPATPAEAPLAEAGEGEAEGQEQTELELREAAEPSDGMSPEQAQIEDAIDRSANPSESVEPSKPADDSEWQTWSGRSVDP